MIFQWTWLAHIQIGFSLFMKCVELKFIKCLAPCNERCPQQIPQPSASLLNFFFSLFPLVPGLFKGSTRQLMEVGTRVVPAERPKTLRKLRNVYENVTVDKPSDTDNGLAILSPFDEQEEWNKISEIMATFNAGLFRDGVLVSEMEKEIQARFGECRF